MTARRLLDTAGPLLGLLFVSIIFGILVGPRFFNGANLELIARQTAIVCTAALGMTMVIVTHEMSFAREVASRVVFMDGGLVAQEGSAAELLDRPENPRLAAFLRRFRS